MGTLMMCIASSHVASTHTPHAGVPSVVQQGGFVGATELLCGDHDQVVLMDMNEDVDTLARAIDGLLRDRETLHTVRVVCVWVCLGVGMWVVKCGGEV